MAKGQRSPNPKEEGITRRDFLKASAAAGGLYALTSCAPAATPTVELPATPTSAPTVPPSATTAPARKDLIIALWAEPQALNALDTERMVEYALFQHVYDSICFMDWETASVQPMLAEDWYQEDPLTWIFKVREGAQWHKGYGEVTAEDVAWTANKIIDEKLRMYFGWGSGLVKGGTVLDKYTVKFELNSPWAPFLLTAPLLVQGHVVCKNAYEEMGPEEFARNPIGSGPFEFESWTSANEVVLKKNANYWYEGRPILEELVFVPVLDSFVRMEKLKKGEIDWMDIPDLKDVPEAEANPDLTVISAPALEWDFMSFNLQNPDLPVSKKEARQAIAYAIDRNEIVESVYYGYALADDDMYCPGVMGDDPEPQMYPNTADLEKARELLTEAGLPDGFSIDCQTSEKPNLRRELEIVADQLSKIGITINIEPLDMATFTQRNKDDDFEMNLEDVTLATGDPDSSVYWFHHKDTLSWHGWDAPDVDELLDNARGESDIDKRTEMYRQIADRVLEDVPFTYICHPYAVYLMKKGVTGFFPTPQRLFPRFDTVSWET